MGITGEDAPVQGSSPQVRGTLNATGHIIRVPGLIPAGAGNMYKLATFTVSARAHPRRCGEHKKLQSAEILESGSSPQVRGTFNICQVCNIIRGLIPAGAGNIACTAQENGGHGAHPRRCGEH